VAASANLTQAWGFAVAGIEAELEAELEAESGAEAKG